ncbi:type II and III secretion system protein family protein [Brevundimonas naejangsanensis]|uniref:Type II and III secretion system protein family protein n=1 Tax=Brevundimonas naejangsanensis TaxID=588932 RepID=A0A494RCC7_9CAUL|nr:type II and III secretion system protein family protein [Brevundimonas naejangsanensis]AYG93925.1 type II and III secretion system protein family protein [Brevundimonas naejangsanensis]
MKSHNAHAIQHRAGRLAAAAASALLLGLTGLAAEAAAQDRPTPYPAMEDRQSGELFLSPGAARTVDVPEGYTALMIGDAEIADVMPLNSRSVHVVAKKMGSTTLTVRGAGGRAMANMAITVGPDVNGLKQRIHEILPAETRVAIRASNESIVLSGPVGSPVALGQIMTLAESYAPGHVVNLMSVEGTQQVMLNVRFAEMRSSTARDLRLNVKRDPTGGNPSLDITTGDTLTATAGNLLRTFGKASLVFSAGDGDLTLLFDALETRGLVKTLAEPNLVAMSGDTASFLAGGEFPIPVAVDTQRANGPNVTIEFKQFGVSLAFTPTILADGMINLVVAPEVSSIDPSVSITNGGIIIPGLRVSRANTTVELRDGESFTIAGLLRNDYQNQIRQFPFLGDLPIIGALFKSTGFQRDETELVIVVTPHLVTPRRGRLQTAADNYIPPSDFELFLLGRQTGSAGSVRPEDRVLLRSAPGAGGIEGPHGHVLY